MNKLEELKNKFEDNKKIIEDAEREVNRLKAKIKKEVEEQYSIMDEAFLSNENFIKGLINDLGISLLFDKELVNELMKEDNGNHFRDSYEIRELLNKKITEDLGFKKLFKLSMVNGLELSISISDDKSVVIKNACVCDKILNGFSDVSLNNISIFEDSLSEHGIYSIVKEDGKYNLIIMSYGIRKDLEQFETIEDAFLYVAENLTYG